MKKQILWVFIFAWIVFSLPGADYNYIVKFVFESTDQGKVLKQTPSTGSVVLKQDGTYRLKLSTSIDDEGTYLFEKANAKHSSNVIYFNSKKNFQYFAYPQKNTLEVWLQKSNTGTNIWAHAELSTGGTEPGSTASGNETGSTSTSTDGLIRNGLFTQTVMYGNTSAPIYQYYDRVTGTISADKKGILFKPAGTFYLRSEYGISLLEGTGTYRVTGNQVKMTFTDGSSMTLSFYNGEKELRWYDNGMLISEYYFLGVAK